MAPSSSISVVASSVRVYDPLRVTRPAVAKQPGLRVPCAPSTDDVRARAGAPTKPDEVRASVLRIEGCDDEILADMIHRHLERGGSTQDLAQLLAVLIDGERAGLLANAVAREGTKAFAIGADEGSVRRKHSRSPPSPRKQSRTGSESPPAAAALSKAPPPPPTAALPAAVLAAAASPPATAAAAPLPIAAAAPQPPPPTAPAPPPPTAAAAPPPPSAASTAAAPLVATAAPPAKPRALRDLGPFEGKWGIAKEEGKAQYLDSLDLSWVVRKAAKSIATPPIAFWLDEQRSTLHSKQGPIFGRMVSSVHPPSETTTEETFQGVTSRITSSWDETAEGGGPPTLLCRTTTVGKQDVCDQRSRVSVDAAGQRMSLVVETRLTKTPGAPTVVYTRTYKPL